MFTGIVEGTGEVLAAESTEDGLRLRIGTGFDDLEHGQSVSVSGTCLTVEEHGDGAEGAWFETFLAAETRAKTYLGELAPGDRVNLERALRADDRLDGHFVQGHVDATTEVVDVREVGEDWEFEFALPADHARYVVDKGSVSLDGISLTVAERGEGTFTVAVVPTTYDLTTLSDKEPGDPVNVEVDVIAKYAEQLVDGY
ncbi:riboflavin synthase [Halostella litorea]|uniref:riboflavin synthase n=1 Tax=Halostella litorea TaxID=2528831 RepID=UPI0010927120|nr:riboflavin synthase [Halostella litorea]